MNNNYCYNNYSVDQQFYETTIISPISYKIVLNSYDNEEIVNDNNINDIREVATKAEVVCCSIN
ncbi:hypothetical protein H8356DRAFT_1362055 [Neocallimastix lanati (nom. inval.)]|nr:hypothetical protein H8356DRAFT_1362055 [Neocallimastix sp. JGI-2020a]